MTEPAYSPPPAGKVRLVRIDEDRADQRLDNFLFGQLKGAPRSLIYKIIRSGQVRVNGGRAKAETRLEGGDEVRIPPVRLAEPGEFDPPLVEAPGFGGRQPGAAGEQQGDSRQRRDKQVSTHPQFLYRR